MLSQRRKKRRLPLFKNEAEFSRTVRAWLASYGFAVQSIESAGVAVGIPDLYFSGEACKGWIELKCVKTAKDACHVPFRPGQYSWLRRFNKHGTFCVLLIAYEEGVAVMLGENIQIEYTVKDIHFYTVPSTGAECVGAIKGAYLAEENNRHRDDDNGSIHSINPVSGYIRTESPARADNGGSAT